MSIICTFIISLYKSTAIQKDKKINNTNNNIAYFMYFEEKKNDNLFFKYEEKTIRCYWTQIPLHTQILENTHRMQHRKKINSNMRVLYCMCMYLFVYVWLKTTKKKSENHITLNMNGCCLNKTYFHFKVNFVNYVLLYVRSLLSIKGFTRKTQFFSTHSIFFLSFVINPE